MTRLTVLMTVYNGEDYLRETVESVLNQTYKDFKFLILDNASEDNSREIINSYKDNRINLVALPENIGQVAALAKGMDMIDTELAARIDADDICLPQRFEKQVAFIDQNPDVGICGTFARTFGAKSVNWEYPTKPEDIAVKLLFECALAHPSVMMRKQLLDKYNLNYDASLPHSYDWDLWLRTSRHMKLANIPESLLQYRLHSKSESLRTLELQETVAKKLDDSSLALLGLENHPLRQIHRDTASETLKITNRDEAFLHQVKEWFDTLRKANKEHRIYDENALDQFLKNRFFLVLTKNARHSKAAWKYYRQEKLRNYIPLSWALKFMVKIFLKLGME